MIKPTAVCTVDGCDRTQHAHQVCGKHYQHLYVKGALPSASVTELPCVHCGQPMVNRKSHRARYCSSKCREDARAAANREKRAHVYRGRVCVHCGDPIGEDKDARARTCTRECSVAYQNARKAAERAARLVEDRARTNPKCKACDEPIPGRRRRGVHYCSELCKHRHTQANWKARDPDRIRAYQRVYRYGLTTEAYDALLDRQDGKCAICGTTEWRGRGDHPHIDHCHETDRVRGLLCRGCNNGLGHFGDDPARLLAAVEYLRRNAPN